ncbi:MAG: hypothetical protein WBG86_14040 [Polyangiales bacterium]
MPAWSSLEIGGSFFAVSPDCRFVVYERLTSSLGMGVEGVLDEEQARSLSELLALEQWENLEPAHSLGSCAPDTGGTTYRWGDRSLDVALCIAGPMLPSDIRQIHNDLFDVIEELRALGEPVSGPARYILTPLGAGHVIGAEFDGAPEWPLDLPPALLSLPLRPDPNDDLFLQPTQRKAWVAVEEDAAQLRSLRTSLLNREFGTTSRGTIPILQPDGFKYRLSFRDVLPGFEEDGRPVVPWLTEGGIGIVAVVRADVSGIDFNVYCADAPDPIATGSLENTYGPTDTTYCEGIATDLPAGPCRLELHASGGEGSVDCVHYTDIGSTAVVTVRPGLTESSSFRCGDVR